MKREMAELTPLTEEELDGLLDSLKFSVPGGFTRLIAELRALREAARAVEAILSRGERVTVVEYRALRNLLPPPPVVALDGSGERG